MALELAELTILPLTGLVGAAGLGALFAVAATRRSQLPTTASGECATRDAAPADPFASDALLVLRRQRDRGGVALVREALRRRLHAGEADTLQDLSSRSSSPALHDAVVAVEHGTFTYDEDLPRALHVVCGAFERLIATTP